MPNLFIYDAKMKRDDLRSVQLIPMFPPDSSQTGSFSYDLTFSLELIRLQK
jgi:hypothetical protein